MAEDILITRICKSMKQVVADYFAALSTEEKTTENLYIQKSSFVKESPAILFLAERSREEPVGSGNFWVRAEVQVRTPAAADSDGVDPVPDGDSLAGNCFDALNRIDLSVLMMIAEAGLTVFGFGEEFEMEKMDHDGESDHFVDVWRRMIYCCAETFPESFSVDIPAASESSGEEVVIT